MLKRLSHAQRDGDRILAVIRGGAVNQDGASGGLTIPSGPAQQMVIREALQRSGVAARDVSYVEAHGTGTSLGDPIEARAVAAIYREGRPASRPLLLGLVKANIGHLEAAAGIAGLIKVVLSLQNNQFPPQRNFHTPSEHIPWYELPITVSKTLLPWDENHPRLAGVSSFGSLARTHIWFSKVHRRSPTPDPTMLPQRGQYPRSTAHHLLSLSEKVGKRRRIGWSIP